MKKPVEIDDELDIEYMTLLMAARARPRKAGIYSPSALSECLRRVYFTKQRTKGFRPESIATSGYFLRGNFMHLQWQFVAWKMHRAGVIQLVGQRTKKDPLGAEIFVSNRNGDFGGSIDNVILLPEEDILVTVDWKSMNSQNFMRFINSGPPNSYKIQSTGYAHLADHDETLELPKKIDLILIVGEKKEPQRTRFAPSPLGLYEWRYAPTDYYRPMQSRLKTLRSHVRRGKTPPIECTSTHRVMFTGCPFAEICRGEVERVERRAKKKRLKKKPKDKPKIQIATKRRNGKEG